MSERTYLDGMAAPHELERARQKRWHRCALIVVASALAFGGLEVLYTSPLLPMLGLRVVVRPFWHYITAAPVVIALYALLKMLVTVPAHRKELAFNTNVFAGVEPGALQALMRSRYERARYDGAKLRRELGELRGRLLRALLLMVVFAALTLIAVYAPALFDVSPEVDLISFFIVMLPYVCGLISVSAGMEMFGVGLKWAELRTKTRDKRVLEYDLAHARRELHGEDATGALSVTQERFDGSGDLSMHRGAHEL